MAKKYIDAKWHYPQKGEYPVIYGEYEHKHYPQIPCLVFYHGMYGVRFWNCTEECWDDEECDDFYCSKEEVERWMYIDSLQQEQPSEELEEEIQRYLREECSSDDEPTIGEIARHFAGWQKSQLLKDAMEADVNTFTDLVVGKNWAEFVAEMPTNNLGDKVKIIIIKEEQK